MTHDELVDIAIAKDLNKLIRKQMKAIDAVFELHKPYQHEVVSYVFCKGCTIDLDLAPPYPCETIQAIEKELS